MNIEDSFNTDSYNYLISYINWIFECYSMGGDMIASGIIATFNGEEKVNILRETFISSNTKNLVFSSGIIEATAYNYNETPDGKMIAFCRELRINVALKIVYNRLESLSKTKYKPYEFDLSCFSSFSKPYQKSLICNSLFYNVEAIDDTKYTDWVVKSCIDNGERSSIYLVICRTTNCENIMKITTGQIWAIDKEIECQKISAYYSLAPQIHYSGIRIGERYGTGIIIMNKMDISLFTLIHTLIFTDEQLKIIYDLISEKLKELIEKYRVIHVDCLSHNIMFKEIYTGRESSATYGNPSVFVESLISGKCKIMFIDYGWAICYERFDATSLCDLRLQYSPVIKRINLLGCKSEKLFTKEDLKDYLIYYSYASLYESLESSKSIEYFGEKMECYKKNTGCTKIKL